MDITLLCYGSRGDVQPYVALGRGLRHVGHQVRMAAPPNFASVAEGQGIDFFPVGVDLQAHLNERIKALSASGRSINNLLSLRNEMLSIVDQAGRDTWEACQGTDLVIGVGPGSLSIAEKLGIPLIA